ncbi:hypothetical protein KAR91_83710 [Candidatus Pacearchaeota archaeon]|nr:hypothetical protein [Candidatus Pacearchaeota archaeon]
MFLFDLRTTYQTAKALSSYFWEHPSITETFQALLSGHPEALLDEDLSMAPGDGTLMGCESATFQKPTTTAGSIRRRYDNDFHIDFLPDCPDLPLSLPEGD